MCGLLHFLKHMEISISRAWYMLTAVIRRGNFVPCVACVEFLVLQSTDVEF